MNNMYFYDDSPLLCLRSQMDFQPLFHTNKKWMFSTIDEICDPTCIVFVVAVATPGFCAEWVAAIPIGSCFTVTLPTTLAAGTAVAFAIAPADAVTGAVTGILTVIIVVGVALTGVDTEDWEIVRATTGLERTWECCWFNESYFILTGFLKGRAKSEYEPSDLLNMRLSLISVAWKWLGVPLFPLDGMLVHQKNCLHYLNTWVERCTIYERKLSCPRAQHNSLARAWTLTTWSGVECTNHEAIRPLLGFIYSGTSI